MQAVMAGIVTGKKNLITKNNKMMAFVDLEDLYGTIEVVVFPNVFERFGGLIAEDAIISISGSINFKEGEVPKLLAERIVDLRSLRETGGDGVKANASQNGKLPGRQPAAEPDGIIKIKLPEGNQGSILEQIQTAMKQHKGRYQAIIYRPEGGSFRTEENLWVDPCHLFRCKITAIVGEENYKDEM